jgi:UDP-glucose 4-epimerase
MENMKVAVTGASGFVGSWLSRVLSKNHKVTCLLRKDSRLDKIIDIANVEISRQKNACWSEYLLSECPDVLILNDWTGVGNENRNDIEQFANVDRLLQISRVALDAGVKKIIGVGSQAELGPISGLIPDSAPDNPTTIYGKAKVETRNRIQELLEGTDVDFVWARIFSTYGPLDEGAWLVPTIVDSLLGGKSIAMTKGEQVWSYLHIYDLATAFATILNNPETTGIINVGNPQTISIRDVGLKIGQILDKSELLDFGAIEYRHDQVMRLQPMCETIIGAGWYPQIAFNEGIQQTIDWLKGKPLKPLLTIDGSFLDVKLPVRP